MGPRSGSHPQWAFPGDGQMKPKQQEIERLRRELMRLTSCRAADALHGLTAQLVTEALVMAIWRRGKPDARTRNHARKDVFDYSVRFYHPMPRHSTLGYLSPKGFEKRAHVA